MSTVTDKVYEYEKQPKENVLRKITDFVKLQGLKYYFPEKFSCNLKFCESENFSDSSPHRILDSETLRSFKKVPFCTKNGFTLGVKWEELNFRKS